MNKFLIPFGPGISGTIPSYDVAEPLEVSGGYFRIPYFDAMSQQVLYRTLNFGTVYNTANGAYINQEFREVLWQTVKSDFQQLKLGDPARTVETSQTGGLLWWFAQGVGAVTIKITQQSTQVNEWFPQSNFGKWGWFAWGYGNNLMPVSWINQQETTFLYAYDDSGANGCSIYLFPGCVAKVTFLYRRDYPQIICNFHSSDFYYPGDNDGKLLYSPPVAVPPAPSILPQVVG